jgi:hypothetical protein
MIDHKAGSQFVWSKYVLLVGLVFVCASFAYITWWSFGETHQWFSFLDIESNDYVSLALALIFQYGQGPVLFLRSLFIYRKLQLEAELRRGTRGTIQYSVLQHEAMIATWAAWGLLALFFVFASVDAWTNKEQMWAGLDAKRAQGILITSDKYFFTLIVGIVAVFVEEGLGISFSLASHTFNDLRQLHGFKRIPWLDVFADNARSLLSGSTNTSSSNNRQQVGLHKHSEGSSYKYDSLHGLGTRGHSQSNSVSDLHTPVIRNKTKP